MALTSLLNPPGEIQTASGVPWPIERRRNIAELSDLKGRTALVTGGAGHIGSALAEALIEAGANVAIMDLDPKRCRHAVDRLTAGHGAVATAHPFDLAEPEHLKRVCEDIAMLHGSLDIVVHAAAWTGATSIPGWNEPFAEQTTTAWTQSLAVNLTSAFALAQASSDLLALSGHGSLILIGSIYGSVGPDWRLYVDTNMTCPAAYAAAKGGVHQLTRYLATTLAPQIRVNLIAPGGILRGQPAAFVERYANRTPLGRMGSEEDLKGAVAFLASDLSRYVTGIELPVNGGWTAW